MLLQLKIVILLLLSATAAVAAQGKPGCLDHCGNVSIPYPFGVQGCNLSSEFLITCNDSFNPPVAFLLDSNIGVSDISVEDGLLTIMIGIARDCYDRQGMHSQAVAGDEGWWFTLADFSVSKSHNKFTVIGCDSFAFISGSRYINDHKEEYQSGCMSFCSKKEFVDENSCSGSGCCQIEIPDGLQSTNFNAFSFNNHTNMSDFNLCTYAFIVQNDRFKFEMSYLKEIPADKKFPVVLEWAINDTKVNDGCKDHATKYHPWENNTSEYRCKCEKGYHGNPYVGCQDIDECRDKTHNCTHNCTNTNGDYICLCPDGYHGDGRKDGEGCKLNCPNGYHRDERKDGESCIRNELLFVPIFLSVGIGLVALVVVSSWFYLIFRKRKLIKLKEKFFEQNGGAILREKLSDGEAGTSFAAQIFTAEELKKATNNYIQSSIIGKGGFGTVYKGILTDDRVVAIKKSITVEQNQIEQFINEVVVLSQINHRNVVKLLGCCLETQVPLLVYEFITNGTLFDYIHHQCNESALSWEIRLRIVAETAGALSYLHSAASIPIIHRDIKTTNILLDSNHTAKVSDFGASRLVPVDETQLSTMVQGTLGYLDPEYLRTNQLTEKSDVYSFGVVLIEVLTSMKALSFNRPEEERSLAMYFLSTFKKGDLFGIVDSRIINEENKQQIEEVARLAVRCIALKGEERPSMKEVDMELQGLRMMEIHPWLQVNQEVTEHLLSETSNDLGIGDAGNSSIGYDSFSICMKDHIILPVDGGR